MVDHNAIAASMRPKDDLTGGIVNVKAPGAARPGIQFLPMDAAERKKLPVATGVVDYFPLALIAISELSRIGNDQHNPGQPLHWARGKGGNNADELMRHFIERGTVDGDNVRHSTKVAWRALALLQLELEAAAKQEKPEPNPHCGKPKCNNPWGPCFGGCDQGHPPQCAFEQKHPPAGTNYACAKCHCSVGDELRPSGCKNWIEEKRKPFPASEFGKFE
jgi:hypothetical protein